MVKLILNPALYQVMRSFLKDSVYCNMTPLIIGPTVLFVSKEPKAKEMLTTLRASPQMTLLGTFVFSVCMTYSFNSVPKRPLWHESRCCDVNLKGCFVCHRLN